MDRRSPLPCITYIVLLSLCVMAAPAGTAGGSTAAPNISTYVSPIIANTGGGRWSRVGAVTGGPIKNLRVDTAHFGTLYGLGGPGVVESTDQGNSWHPILSLPGATALSITPGPLATLYVGSLNRGIWRSADGGRTWKSVVDGLPDDQSASASRGDISWVVTLASHPTDPRIAYASMHDGGLYRTADAGSHWVPISTGIRRLIDVIVVDPLHPQVVYLGSEAFSGGTTGTVYKSIDSGGTWNEMPLITNAINSIAIDASDDQTLYVSAFQKAYSSKDGGSNWSSVSIPVIDLQTIEVDPSNARHLLLGTYTHGLYQSSDAGAHWAPSSTDAPDASDFAMDPRHPALMFAASKFGPLRSADGGATWTTIEAENVGVLPAAMLVDRDHAIYLGSTDHGVFKSTDGGRSWHRTNNGGDFGSLAQVAALTLDPSAAGTVYAASEQGLFKTTDGGSDWMPINKSLRASMALTVVVDPKNPQVIYASAFHLFKSIDGGASWRPSSNGLPGGVQALAVDPSDSRVVFAGTQNDGLYKSTDGGASWSPAGGPFGRDVGFIAIDPKHPNTVYICGLGVIYKSIDGGTTWSILVGQFPALFMPHYIQIDPHNSAVLYAYGFNGNPYYSLDGGVHWQAMDQGLRSFQVNLPGVPTPLYIQTLAIDPGTGSIYGVGNDSNLYVYTGLSR